MKSGLAGIEGPNLLEEALRAGLRIDCVFVGRGRGAPARGACAAPGDRSAAAAEELLDAALATETPQPIAALVEPPEWTWATLPRRRPATKTVRRLLVLVVLAGMQDPGNLGTILRSAEAFGANGMVCLPGTVSAWNPKAVRASAGSVFRVPLLAASDGGCFQAPARSRT